MANQVLNAVSTNEMMRAKIRSREKAERDDIAGLNTAHYEGREEGEAIGERRGEVDNKLKTARRLLIKGSNAEFIADVTELSMAEIKALAREISAQQ